MKTLKRQVTLKGIRPIMFDRYPGDNKTQLMPEEKMYLNGQNQLILPSVNIHSFLSAQNTRSAVKTFYDSRKYKTVATAILGFVTIEPLDVLITRNGEPVSWEGWDKNGIWLHESVARLDKGVPNPKKRPVLDTPWEISFELTLFENDTVSEGEIRNLFVRGGVALGLGTYRGIFGKFIIDKWE